MASNLDYSGGETFAPLTVKADFVFNGVIRYQANMILGFYGFTRVFKRLKDGSILQMSLNERQSHSFKLADFLKQIADKTNLNTLRFFRQTFEKAQNYQELKSEILDVEGKNLGAPFYIIMNS